MSSRRLHLTRDFPPRSVGGVSIAVGGMVERARAEGHVQAVVSFDRWRPGRTEQVTLEREDMADVPVLRVRGGSPGAELARFIADLAPDALWLHDGLVAAFAPAGIARVQVVHVLSHLQDRLRDCPPTATTMALTTALALADRVLVTTQAARAALLAEHPELTARTDIEPLVPTLPRRPRAPGADAPIVLAGRFDTLKGTDVVAAALPRLLALRPVVLAGGVPGNAKAERRWGQRLAGATLTGWLDPDALADLMSRAAVFVAPSRLETCGLSLLEAVDLGVPAVASDLPAHREVAPGARFFPSGDVDALVAAVALVIAGESR